MNFFTMVRSIIKYILFISMFFTPLAAAHAQDNKPNKVQKKADKKKEQRVENEKKSEIKGRKRHMALQTKDVRRRMRRHSHYVNSEQLHRKRGFFYRLFHRNEH
jgi:hypothetical protein